MISRRSRSPLPAVLAIVVPVVAGCGGSSETPSPAGLAYDRPDPNPATYTFTDTMELSVETAVGAMTALTALDGTAELEFRARDHEFQVLVRFPELRGVFRNPVQAPAVVDESAVGGPFTVRVGPAGFVAVTDTPSLDGALPDIAGPERLARSFFAHLPGGPVGEDARWVDTVTIGEASQGTRSVTRTIIVSTLAGDTVVAGRRLLRIRTEAESELEQAGVSGGVEVEQTLAGTLTGTVLWDRGARVLFGRTESGSLSGTLVLPDAAGGPLPVEVRIRRSLTLRE